MTTLTYVDRFILALWKRNDQLSVYNPGLKTQYDTYSWVKDFGGSTDPDMITKRLYNYKKDLLDSLTYDDSFPMSFDEGKERVERFVGKDSRNMSKWLGNQYQELKGKKLLTYAELAAEYLTKPLGSRYSPAKDTIGFIDATFVETVEEKFMYGMFSRPEIIFRNSSKSQDMAMYGSSYFWFMYGILPRKNITYLEIADGLFIEDKDENKVKITKTIQFLGLVFNIQAPSVRFIIKNPAGEGNKESETFKFINTYSEIPHPIDAKVELRPLMIDENNEIKHINIDKPKEAQPGGQVVDGKLRQLNEELSGIQRKIDNEKKNPNWSKDDAIKKRVETYEANKKEKLKQIDARRALVNSQNQGVGTTGQGGSGAPAATPGLSRQERKQAARADQLSGN